MIDCQDHHHAKTSILTPQALHVLLVVYQLQTTVQYVIASWLVGWDVSSSLLFGCKAIVKRVQQLTYSRHTRVQQYGWTDVMSLCNQHSELRHGTWNSWPSLTSSLSAITAVTGTTCSKVKAVCSWLMGRRMWMLVQDKIRQDKRHAITHRSGQCLSLEANQQNNSSHTYHIYPFGFLGLSTRHILHSLVHSSNTSIYR